MKFICPKCGMTTKQAPANYQCVTQGCNGLLIDFVYGEDIVEMMRKRTTAGAKANQEKAFDIKFRSYSANVNPVVPTSSPMPVDASSQQGKKVNLYSKQTPKPADTNARLQQSLAGKENRSSLAILLLHTSYAMNQLAFPNLENPQSRRRILANTIAAAIFKKALDPNKAHAFVFLYKFNKELELIFDKSISEITFEYGQESHLAAFLYEELKATPGPAKIHRALHEAYSLAFEFVNKKLQHRIGAYHPFDLSKAAYSYVPNVRVVLFTDGTQVSDRDLLKIKNPFQKGQSEVFSSVFVGDMESRLVGILREMMGKCPIHDDSQLLLLNSAEQLDNFDRLFTAIINAKGFCQYCQS